MQSRKLSILEAIANTLIGYIIAILTQLVTFPLFNIHITIKEDMLIGLIFLIVSLVRNYLIRRFFNRVRG